MKKKLELVGIIALVVLIMFPFVSYGQSSSSQALTLTSIDDLDKWLDSQPFNTVQTSYAIKMNVRDFTGIGYVLNTYPKKYVSLYFSNNTLTGIEGQAFYGCTSLASVTIPNSVISIGREAFSGCSSLVSVTIPDSVTSIGLEAFGYCSSLVNVTIPNSVTSIGSFAFSGCASLASITIPDSVTGDINGFGGCDRLANVIIGNNVTSINGFEDCKSLTSITIGNRVTTIGIRAFYGCKLKNVIIPDSVTVIEARAFEGNPLVNVIIGSGVTDIKIMAFGRCGYLSRVEFKGTIPMEKFHVEAFGRSNLREKFYETNSRNGGNHGIYTSSDGLTWTKQ
jgi:hypothetical protein